MITRVKKGELGQEEINAEKRVEEFPNMDYILKKGDILVIYGKPENLEKFEQDCIK